jgi:hypothetical protein
MHRLGLYRLGVSKVSRHSTLKRIQSQIGSKRGEE